MFLFNHGEKSPIVELQGNLFLGMQIMANNDLLTSIWSGEVNVCGDDNLSPLAVLLSSVLTVPTVSLTSTAGISKPMAYSDGTELLPGLQLGDVLEEELGCEIPPNCVILLEPEERVREDAFSSDELGRDLGRVLTAVANEGLHTEDAQLPAMQRAGQRPVFSQRASA